MTETANDKDLTATTLRRLALEWTAFEERLDKVPLLARLSQERFSKQDYLSLLLNLRQQVVEGGAWIARAASHVSADFAGIRSYFLRHAVREHRDFRMLEDAYVALGGSLDVIRSTPKNAGSEALSAFMYHKASQPNPFALLGAMFMIEGLGQHKAGEWGAAIQRQLNLADEVVAFFQYHSDNDGDHMAEFADLVGTCIQTDKAANDLVMTARVVGRLYAMQIEEASPA